VTDTIDGDHRHIPLDDHLRHKAYKGLHGESLESENADYTVSTLTGTVSR
jgi:hypothetical protein